MASLGLGDASGDMIGDRYIIERRLGKKAGRQTLLARDLETQELVVIKLLTFGNDLNWDDLKLFERETETLKTLSHPAIPRYLNSFEITALNAKAFALVQSYIEAKSLEDHLNSGRRFSETEVKQLGQILLEILMYLHGRQPPVIHRDIKPSNILLTNRSGNSIGQVYLVDFGSVQTLATKEGKTVTVVGTYGYMPPEQFGGRAVAASDLYSLGATLIALVTGQHPADLPQRDMRIQFENVANLSPDFTSWLKWITEPSLEQRPASAELAKNGLEKPWIRGNYSRSLQQRQSVTTLDLLWNSLWRSTLIGTLAVVSYAAIYSTFIFPGVGTITGAMIGIYLGLPLGIGNGLLVGILTRLLFWPLKNAKRHRRVISFFSTVLCTAAALVYFQTSANFTGILGDSYGNIFWIISPSLIAGLSMGVSSKLIARWYEQKALRAKEQ